jgi:hypothetical protein
MPEIQELQDLLRDLLSGVQELLQSGEILSDEFQGEIAKTLTLLTDRIDNLIAEQNQLEEAETEQAEVADALGPPAQPPGVAPPNQPIPALEQAPHESSNINAFRYDPQSGRLFVKFQGKYPAQNGPVYSYENVPNYIYDVFRRGAVGPKTSGRNQWHTWKEGVTPSHGAAMYALIKAGGFPYQRLS